MNTAHVQKLLIDIGYLFKKITPENSDVPRWVCMDDDEIPLCSDRILSKVIWDMDIMLGGVA